MRTFFRETDNAYEHYRFSYQCFAEMERDDSLDQIYAQGFLPASHDTSDPRSVFYLARSLRLDLARIRLGKKRRYLQRRGVEAGLRLEFVSKPEIDSRLPLQWRETVLSWVAARHQPTFLSVERLHYILERPYLNEFAIVHADARWVGLVLLPHGTENAHFWFSLFDGSWEPDRSLGKWILGETAAQLKQRGLKHLYLGTCYGPKARYKFQGIEDGVQFFDGEGWSADHTELERRLDTDQAPPAT